MLILTCSQADNVDISRWAFIESIAEAVRVHVTPPVERVEVIPEVRHFIHLAFRTCFSNAPCI